MLLRAPPGPKALETLIVFATSNEQMRKAHREVTSTLNCLGPEVLPYIFGLIPLAGSNHMVSSADRGAGKCSIAGAQDRGT